MALRQIPPSLSSYHNALRSKFPLAIDQSAFHFVAGPTSAEDIAGSSLIRGLIEREDASDSSVAVHKLAVRVGPNPVIIDQSILPYGTIWASVEHSSVTPKAVQAVVDHVIAGLELGGVLSPSAREKRSGTAPTYVLVHENVSTTFVGALRAALPSSFPIQELPLVSCASTMGDVIAGELDYLPVFIVSTLDLATDTANQDLKPASIAYVFAGTDTIRSVCRQQPGHAAGRPQRGSG